MGSTTHVTKFNLVQLKYRGVTYNFWSPDNLYIVSVFYMNHARILIRTFLEKHLGTSKYLRRKLREISRLCCWEPKAPLQVQLPLPRCLVSNLTLSNLLQFADEVYGSKEKQTDDCLTTTEWESSVQAEQTKRQGFPLYRTRIRLIDWFRQTLP